MPTLRLGRYDAGRGMGVTWPVSSKQRQGTADRVGEVYRVRWSR